MPEGVAPGAPGRRKKEQPAEQPAMFDSPKMQIHKLVAPQHILLLDEMHLHKWKPVTTIELRKALGWAENTVVRILVNNGLLFAPSGDGWRATHIGRDEYETWKLQVYNAKGVTQ